MMVDPDGNLPPEGAGPPSREDVVEPGAGRSAPAEPAEPGGEVLNEEWLDRVTRRPPPPPPPPPERERERETPL
jgi:hypothetical protein